MRPAKIITANRLGDGAAVFLGLSGEWLSQVQSARVAFSTEEETALVALADAAEAANLITGAYLVPVQVHNGATVPIALREMIRSKGPSHVSL